MITIKLSLYENKDLFLLLEKEFYRLIKLYKREHEYLNLAFLKFLLHIDEDKISLGFVFIDEDEEEIELDYFTLLLIVNAQKTLKQERKIKFNEKLLGIIRRIRKTWAELEDEE